MVIDGGTGNLKQCALLRNWEFITSVDEGSSYRLWSLASPRSKKSLSIVSSPILA